MSKPQTFWNTLNDGDISNWRMVKISYGAGTCACGTPITNIFTIEHNSDGRRKTIGYCCARKLGIRLRWSNVPDYLANAYLAASSDIERNFVRSLQNKLPTWGKRLIISSKQKDWLEKITGKRWSWKTWP